jgi:5S rRNA maturation endonuclease (ribonuclease M5)
MYLDEVLEVLKRTTGHKPRKSGNDYITKCPAHDDQNPSLSVTEGADGRVLVHCHSRCEIEAICESLKISIKDLFSTKPNPSTHVSSKYTEYIYVDVYNNPLYKKVRIEPGKDGKAKDFYISSVNSNGEWKKGLSRTSKRFLYMINDVLKAIREGKEIYLVEGEKDADRLFREGLIATTMIEGAGAKIRPEYVQQVQNAKINLLYDEDKAGHSFRDALCDALINKVKTLKVIKLPGLEYRESHGLDISDWLNLGHTIEELKQLVNKTNFIGCEDQKNNSKSKNLLVVTLEEFVKRNIPIREMILSPILPSQGLAMLYAKTGVGKTFVGLMIAYAVSTGGRVFTWTAPKPRKVLYIDGEMPANLLQDRLKAIVKGMGSKIDNPPPFRIITPDLQPNGIPDLITLEGQMMVEAILEDTEFLILDNLSCLLQNLKENDIDTWRPFQFWLLNLRRRGLTVLFLHHAGRSGNQRGTTGREDVLDAIISLKHPPSYKHEEGAKFIVRNEKPRGLVGKDVEPFSVQITIDQERGLSWEIQGIKENYFDETYDKVVELRFEGKSIRDIAEELKIGRSKVHTLIKKARECGDIAQEE